MLKRGTPSQEIGHASAPNLSIRRWGRGQGGNLSRLPPASSQLGPTPPNHGHYQVLPESSLSPTVAAATCFAEDYSPRHAAIPSPWRFQRRGQRRPNAQLCRNYRLCYGAIGSFEDTINTSAVTASATSDRAFAAPKGCFPSRCLPSRP